MVAVYIDAAGDVRSQNTDRIIAPAGTTPREARVRAALLAAAADALQSATTAGSATAGTARGPATGMPTVVAPIQDAPSYARTVGQARRKLAVIDIARMREETAAQIAAATGEDPSCL